MLISLVLLASCASFPVLDRTISDAARAAPYPELTPIPADDPVGDVAVLPADAGLSARIAELNARAAQLRATPIAALQ